MSKHLLRKLLKLDTELDTEKSHEQSDTEKSSKSKMYIKDNTKEGVYYSTDLGKTVFTRIPKHMKISYETSLPYDDTTEQQDTDITTTEYTQNTNKKTLENTNKMYIKDNTKDALYYSTDKGRSVFTRIPKHMKISYETSLPEQTVQTYTDDLSDVSSNLLKTIIYTSSLLVTLNTILLDLYCVLRMLKNPDNNIHPILSLGFFGDTHTRSIVKILSHPLINYNIQIIKQPKNNVSRCITFSDKINLYNDIIQHARFLYSNNPQKAATCHRWAG